MAAGSYRRCIKLGAGVIFSKTCETSRVDHERGEFFLVGAPSESWRQSQRGTDEGGSGAWYTSRESKWNLNTGLSLLFVRG